MKKFIHIIDNRNEKADLEIDNEGYGRWYVWNECTDKIVATRTKQQATEIRTNFNEWDI